jgi:CRISPR-associated protein Csm5
MNFLENHDLLISTLSPVHIGCGEDYEPTNYVIEGETLYAFDPARLLAELGQAQRDELSRSLDAPNPLLSAQRFFYRHRQAAMAIAGHTSPVLAAVAQVYASRIGQVAQREGGGASVINKLEIARTAFNPHDGLPILPGSSLKGALRTAVLERLRREKGASFPLSDRDAGNFKAASNTANRMEQDLMAGSFQTDPLRLVKIGDAAFQAGSYKAKNAQGQEIQVERKPRSILFQANRKKRPNQFAARGNIQTLVECVPAGQARAFRASLVLEQKAGQAEDRPELQASFGWLADACNDFYMPRLDAELRLLEANHYVSEAWAKNARARLAPTGLWGKAIAERRGFLLRVGRHSGAESVTVDAPRKIKILGAKGALPTWAREATTVWLAANTPDAQTGMWPFGWVFVQRAK